MNMINLKTRLQIIADNIERRETMADIGTDHGFLPIYLISQGICPRAVLTDVSLPSLNKAIVNCRQSLKGNTFHRIDFRAGDGLQVLSNGEVDVVVIAGMGGKTMIDILEEDITKSRSFKKFILQPRIGQGVLRKWLYEHDFAIVGEAVVHEGHYIPEIIIACPVGGSEESLAGLQQASGKETATGPQQLDCIVGYRAEMSNLDADNIRWRVPPWIVDATGPVEDFLTLNITREKRVLEGVMKAKDGRVKIEELQGNIAYLENLLRRCKHGK